MRIVARACERAKAVARRGAVRLDYARESPGRARARGVIRSVGVGAWSLVMIGENVARV